MRQMRKCLLVRAFFAPFAWGATGQIFFWYAPAQVVVFLAPATSGVLLQVFQPLQTGAASCSPREHQSFTCSNHPGGRPAPRSPTTRTNPRHS